MKSLTIGGVSVAIALVLTGCAAPGAQDSSDLTGGQLVVGSYGGDVDAFLKSFTNPVFHQEMPDVEVLYSSGDTESRKTKLLVEADASAGTFDVVQLSDRDLPRMINAGVLLELDPARIPNWDNINPTLVNNYCVPHITSAVVAIYNPERVEPIVSWNDFFEPQTLDQAGVWSRDSEFLIFAAAAGKKGSDPGTDLEPGLQDAIDAGNQMRHYGSNAQIGQALMSGEISAVIGMRARAAMWSDESGIPFASSVPTEGTFRYLSYACIPSNARNVEAAYAFLNAQLSPESQQGFAENMYYEPTVTNAAISPELQAAIGVSEDEATRISPHDYGPLEAVLPELQKQWDQATK